jgi:UDP-N-acetylglucosamine 2-epimerase (non-hydrolysing)
MVELKPILEKEKVDVLIVQGDTSSAFVAALCAFYNKITVAHVEAGLRTHNKFDPFPEEINRRLISQIADFSFAPTSLNKKHLQDENIPDSTIFVTGNTVIDALLQTAKKPYKFTDPLLSKLYSRTSRKILITAHRRENHGIPLESICKALVKITETYQDLELLYPVHMNPNVRKTVNSILSNKPRIHLIGPLGYLDFVHAQKNSYLIMSDSGGVQEEAPSLGKPVLVMRETTERPEAVTAGTVKIIGTETDNIFNEVSKLISDKTAYNAMSQAVNPYGDGHASERIIQALKYAFKLSTNMPSIFSPQPTQ